MVLQTRRVVMQAVARTIKVEEEASLDSK